MLRAPLESGPPALVAAAAASARCTAAMSRNGSVKLGAEVHTTRAFCTTSHSCRGRQRGVGMQYCQFGQDSARCMPACRPALTWQPACLDLHSLPLEHAKYVPDLPLMHTTYKGEVSGELQR